MFELVKRTSTISRKLFEKVLGKSKLNSVFSRVAASGEENQRGNLLTVEADENMCSLERVRVSVGKLQFEKLPFSARLRQP